MFFLINNCLMLWIMIILLFIFSSASSNFTNPFNSCPFILDSFFVPFSRLIIIPVVNCFMLISIDISINYHCSVLSIKLFEWRVYFFNLFHLEVLSISIMILNYSCSVNFCKINSNHSIVAAFHKDFTWAFTVCFCFLMHSLPHPIMAASWSIAW